LSNTEKRLKEWTEKQKELQEKLDGICKVFNEDRLEEINRDYDEFYESEVV
ncbi:uncharacterized protein METZ01_LOCUS511298, partial [marine metagenome]